MVHTLLAPFPVPLQHPTPFLNSNLSNLMHAIPNALKPLLVRRTQRLLFDVTIRDGNP